MKALIAFILKWRILIASLIVIGTGVWAYAIKAPLGFTGWACLLFLVAGFLMGRNNPGIGR